MLSEKIVYENGLSYTVESLFEWGSPRLEQQYYFYIIKGNFSVKHTAVPFFFIFSLSAGEIAEYYERITTDSEDIFECITNTLDILLGDIPVNDIDSLNEICVENNRKYTEIMDSIINSQIKK